MMAMRILNFLFIAAVFLELQSTEGKLKSLRAVNKLNDKGENSAGPKAAAAQREKSGTRGSKSREKSLAKKHLNSKQHRTQHNGLCIIKFLDLESQSVLSEEQAVHEVETDKRYSKVLTDNSDSISHSTGITLGDIFGVTRTVTTAWRRIDSIASRNESHTDTGEFWRWDYYSESTVFYGRIKTTIIFDDGNSHTPAIELGSDEMRLRLGSIRGKSSLRCNDRKQNCDEQKAIWKKKAWNLLGFAKPPRRGVVEAPFQLAVVPEGIVTEGDTKKTEQVNLGESGQLCKQELDFHTAIPRGSILTGFRLKLSKDEKKFVYNYSFVESPFEEEREKTSNHYTVRKPDHDGNAIKYLDRQHFFDNSGEFLHSFHLTCTDGFKYEYRTSSGFVCDKSTDVYNHTVPSQYGGNVKYLDRHHVTVPLGHGLRRFRLRNIDDLLWIDYWHSPIKIAADNKESEVQSTEPDKQNTATNSRYEIRLLTLTQHAFKKSVMAVHNIEASKLFSRVMADNSEMFSASVGISVEGLPVGGQVSFSKSWRRFRDTVEKRETYRKEKTNTSQSYPPGVTQVFAHFEKTIKFNDNIVSQEEQTIRLGSRKHSCDIHTDNDCETKWKREAWRRLGFTRPRSPPNVDVKVFEFRTDLPETVGLPEIKHRLTPIVKMDKSLHHLDKEKLAIEAPNDDKRGIGILTGFVLKTYTNPGDEYKGAMHYRYSYVEYPSKGKQITTRQSEWEAQSDHETSVKYLDRIQVRAEHDGEFLHGFKLLRQNDKFAYEFKTVGGFDCTKDTDVRDFTTPNDPGPGDKGAIQFLDRHAITVPKGHGLRGFRLHAEGNKAMWYEFWHSPIKIKST